MSAITRDQFYNLYKFKLNELNELDESLELNNLKIGNLCNIYNKLIFRYKSKRNKSNKLVDIYVNNLFAKCFAKTKKQAVSLIETENKNILNLIKNKKLELSDLTSLRRKCEQNISTGKYRIRLNYNNEYYSIKVISFKEKELIFKSKKEVKELLTSFLDLKKRKIFQKNKKNVKTDSIESISSFFEKIKEKLDCLILIYDLTEFKEEINALENKFNSLIKELYQSNKNYLYNVEKFLNSIEVERLEETPTLDNKFFNENVITPYLIFNKKLKEIKKESYDTIEKMKINLKNEKYINSNILISEYHEKENIEHEYINFIKSINFSHIIAPQNRSLSILDEARNFFHKKNICVWELCESSTEEKKVLSRYMLSIVYSLDNIDIIFNSEISKNNGNTNLKTQETKTKLVHLKKLQSNIEFLLQSYKTRKEENFLYKKTLDKIVEKTHKNNIVSNNLTLIDMFQIKNFKGEYIFISEETKSIATSFATKSVKLNRDNENGILEIDKRKFHFFDLNEEKLRKLCFSQRNDNPDMMFHQFRFLVKNYPTCFNQNDKIIRYINYFDKHPNQSSKVYSMETPETSFGGKKRFFFLKLPGQIIRENLFFKESLNARSLTHKIRLKIKEIYPQNIELEELLNMKITLEQSALMTGKRQNRPS